MGMFEDDYYEPPERDESTIKLFDIEINTETEKAYSVIWNHHIFWVPKSQCKLFYGKSTITLKVKCWILDKASIEY